jgi:nickel superoxide dismutase
VKLRYIYILAVVFSMATTGNAWAHCEIPCGIYDDQARANLIGEHIKTIEKSMNQVVEISGQTPVNYNQLVRWVNNKEHHADEIQHIVTQYFMTQRIKPNQESYEKKVTVLHKMLLAAMKCKQTTDLANVKSLTSLLEEFEGLYFGHSHPK